MSIWVWIRADSMFNGARVKATSSLSKEGDEDEDAAWWILESETGVLVNDLISPDVSMWIQR